MALMMMGTRAKQRLVAPLSNKGCNEALNKKIWTVPAIRAKTGREHRVPLSGRAMAILIDEKLQFVPFGLSMP
ncbi:hypothetical protein [Bradyrhizobium sp. F1.13.3]|uniref:hypothetical protein n=1 Tax=Bradyrhizobium sp. F1.13.3 TaxID=3156351 RepID=UPI0033916237